MKELLLCGAVLAIMGAVAYMFHIVQARNNTPEKIEERYQEYRRSLKYK